MSYCAVYVYVVVDISRRLGNIAVREETVKDDFNCREYCGYPNDVVDT